MLPPISTRSTLIKCLFKSKNSVSSIKIVDFSERYKRIIGSVNLLKTCQLRLFSHLNINNLIDHQMKAICNPLSNSHLYYPVCSSYHILNNIGDGNVQICLSNLFYHCVLDTIDKSLNISICRLFGSKYSSHALQPVWNVPKNIFKNGYSLRMAIIHFRFLFIDQTHKSTKKS